MSVPASGLATKRPTWGTPSWGQRHDANQRLIADHCAGHACDYCRPGHGCAALARAQREVAEVQAATG